MDRIYNVPLAGVALPCVFRFPDTARWLGAVPAPASFGQPKAGSGEVPAALRLTEDDWAHYRRDGFAESGQSEANLLSAFLSEALLPYDRVVIHGVALRWRGKAFLICAASGVGKSTQARYLQQLCPGEFSVISGDRPILQFCHCEPCRDGTLPSAASSVPPSRHSERSAAESKNPSSPSPDSEIIVHPSPWNGKENWHGALAAPLAGLILLERGEENNLTRLSPKEAGISTFLRFIHTNRSADTVQTIAKMTTDLLRSVPCWKLTTYQVPDSTRLLLNTVFSEEAPLERKG